ncbi:MAG: hypothetical protein IKL52_04200, partial [Candidatus Gastranaerophilales bacterium]|nr:hypothetical protein [Candidatus Gastranaerophilales bacterium]
MNINRKNGLFINFLSQQTNNNFIRNRKNEEPLFSTQALGEEGGKPDMPILEPDFEFGENTTFALGEEGGMIGDPDEPILNPGPVLEPGNPGEATTQAIG